MTTVLAESPIRPLGPIVERWGWRVSAAPSASGLTLCDESPLVKVQVRAEPADAGVAGSLGGVTHGTTAALDGLLVVGSGPGEWLLIGAPDAGESARGTAAAAVAAAAGRASSVDLTHGRALVRLTGSDAVPTLAKLCAIDLDDRATPDGTALRTSVARLVVDIVRDDRDGVRSYLLHCERSSGQYMFDSIAEAGAEYAIGTLGLAAEA